MEVAEINAANTQKTNIREIALNALLMINEEGSHCTSVINDALAKYDRVDIRDRSLFVKLIHGTLEYQIQLDHVIDRFSSIKTKKMRPIIRNVLRMTAYQILYADKIPDSAAIDEGVKLVKKSALKQLSGFVNAVSRKISSEKSSLCFDDRSVRYSVPDWMLELVDETIGKDRANAFFADALREHGLSIRRVGTDNIEYLDSVDHLSDLEEWRSGKIIAQDYSSAQPVIRAELKKGDTVIDVCAAPGGKSVQAAEHVGCDGLVWACDISEKKTAKIRQNIDRLKINNIKTVVADATQYHEEFESKADCVLADLPCSGIGTISGKPDIKNRLTLKDCRELASLQLKILNNVCNYAAAGGKLIFSTCTIDHFENEDNVRAFLSMNENFELLSEECIVKEGADGFYIAVFRRNQ